MKTYERDERTLPFILEDKAKALGSKVFIRCKDETVTYGELDQKANGIANTLTKKMNLQKGGKVAVMLPNCADYVIVQFGVAKAGGVEVPVNIQATGDLLTHILNNSDAGVLLVDQQFLYLLQPIQDKLDHLKKIILYPRKLGNEESMFGNRYEFISYQDLLEGETSPPQTTVHQAGSNSTNRIQRILNT